ncbi:hypothetical protein OVN20_07060 [Microcella daejeonensis]|uniref:hypothetical protein n=1 Tax=Microcella daejeonensis TaxID=2994971 RepID=UPI002270D8C2|nr:hypothetical protein [Microcella daejeonensis]WAB82876.1 hypothetical protein OVN20_07060 [Microcella daejeonensis]
MTPAERAWSWLQPLIAVLCLAVAVASWSLQAAGDYELLPSVQAVITTSFVYPGLALSLAVNHVIVGFRRPPALSAAEKALVVAQAVIAIVLGLTSLDSAALIVGFLLWPLLIVGAVWACALMTGGTIRIRRESRMPVDPRSGDRLGDGPPTAQIPVVSPAR